jgi:ABC-2 type transport system permease protein
MRSFIAFCRKELMESLRTYKFMILFLIFIFFGFLNPVVAKLLPEILESVLPEGMSITLEEPRAIDSWMQFFKNGSQTGMIVLTVIFSGIMAGEITKGTLVHMVTKGLSRKIVVLSKFFSAVLQWTCAYVVSTLITLGYTIYFFEEMELPHLFLGIVGMWIFGVFLISVVLFGGLLFKNVYGALLLAGGSSLLFTILSLFPDFKRYNPMTLVSENVNLLNGTFKSMDFLMSGFVTGILIVVFVALSMSNMFKLTE